MIRKQRAAFTRRLRCGFSLSILLALVVGTLAINAMWSIVRIKDDVTFKQGERLMNAQEIRGSFLSHWTLFRNQWVKPTKENKEAYNESVRAFERRVELEMKHATPDEKKELAVARDSVRKYNQNLVEYWKELEKPKYAKFRDILAKTAGVRMSAEDALTRLLSRRADGFKHARQVSVREAGRLTYIFMVIAALTSLLVLGLLYMMLKTTTRLYDEAQTAIRVNDEFIAIVSHEIKNPIAAILLQFELLKRMCSEPKTQKVLTAGVNATRNMTRLLESLMETTRARLGEIVLSPEEGDLCKIVKDCLDSFGPQMPLESKIECDRIHGYWDEARVCEVVNNLLSNARRYGNGKLVTVRLWHKEDAAYISVIDRGIGIKKDDLDRIFNRFERGNNRGEYKAGMGIGLYVVREVVTAFGGNVWVESTYGEGSTFTVKLPIKTTPPVLPKEGKYETHPNN